MSSHAEKKDILRAMIPSLLPNRSLLSWKSNIMIHCIASNTIALLRSSSTYYYTLGKDRYLLEVLQNIVLTKNKTEKDRYILTRASSEYHTNKKFSASFLFVNKAISEGSEF